jgi:hypothetical protein
VTCAEKVDKKLQYIVLWQIDNADGKRTQLEKCVVEERLTQKKFLNSIQLDLEMLLMRFELT